MKNYLRNLMRPWKLATFAAGTGFFVWGAQAFDAPTWDVPVSLIMSVVTFLLAPWSVDQLLMGYRGRRAMRLRGIAGVAGIYFCGSGTYELYHLMASGWHPPTYWENLLFSIPTALAAGLCWRLDMTVAELWTHTANAFSEAEAQHHDGDDAPRG